jgi:GNAT superfamily N-acetyltransferase
MKIIRLSGNELTERMPEVAHLRIRVFREFPYLYDGDLEYEKRYLQTYSQSMGSVVVLALDNDQIVGASTAIPMPHETEEVKAPFVAAGYDIDTLFYLGESVLLPEYRGRGIGVAFFENREAHARELGVFTHTCFCAVQRPVDHPSRPADYAPLDAFWQKRGYTKQSDLVAFYSWKEAGEQHESPKPMVFWMKSL